MRGAEADGNARHAADWLNDAHELRRAKGAALKLEAWREIRDTHPTGATVDQLGGNDCRIAHVFGPGFDLSVEHHIREALVFIPGEQAAEHRIAVVTREAPPHEARGRLAEW